MLAVFDQQGFGQFQREVFGGQAAVVEGLPDGGHQITPLGLGG